MSWVPKHPTPRYVTGRLSRMEQDQLVARYTTDPSVTAETLGQEFGISESQVRYILHSLKVRTKGQGYSPWPFSPKVGYRVATLYEAGATLVELAKQFETTEHKIRRVLLDLKVPLRGRYSLHFYPTSVEDEIVRLYTEEETITLQDLADRFGGRRQNIHQVLERRGVPRRRPGRVRGRSPHKRLPTGAGHAIPPLLRSA